MRDTEAASAPAAAPQTPFDAACRGFCLLSSRRSPKNRASTKQGQAIRMPATPKLKNFQEWEPAGRPPSFGTSLRLILLCVQLSRTAVGVRVSAPPRVKRKSKATSRTRHAVFGLVSDPHCFLSALFFLGLGRRPAGTRHDLQTRSAKAHF